ncbi:Ras family protein [Roseateles sp.]|uniref:Ras family protein n=1 Tax=Roseateles sp. TaxID=1971397 RepID=UPI00326453C7
MNLPPIPIAELTDIAQQMAQSMVIVAEQVALLGVDGNADEQMATIKRENDKVLDRIRQIYNLPPAPGR